MAETTEPAAERTPRGRGPVDRLWSTLQRPVVWGGLLLLTGLVLVASVLTTMPPQVSSNWWIVAFRSTEGLRSFVSLSVLGLGVAFLLLMARGRVLRGESEARHEDIVIDEAPDQPGGALKFAPLAGLVLMVVGVSVALGSWAMSQRQMPPSRLTVPTQRKIEAYPAVTATSSVKVMLPARAFVRTIDVAEQSAVLEFLQVGQEEGQGRIQTLRAFDPVEIEGFRWSILGVEYSDSVLSAVVEPKGENAIPAQGAVGDSLQFEIEGTRYKILQITRNYLGVLGPAVELEHPDDGRFWVFQRAGSAKGDPTFVHNLELKRIERAPIAVIAVSQAPAQDLLPVAGILFVLGLALFLFLPELVVRKRDDGYAIWSLNEAGEFADNGGDRG